MHQQQTTNFTTKRVTGIRMHYYWCNLAAVMRMWKTLHTMMCVSYIYIQNTSDYHHQTCNLKFMLTQGHQLTFIFSLLSELQDQSSFVICHQVCHESVNPREPCFYAAGSIQLSWRDGVLERMLRQTTAASSERTAVWRTMMNDSYSELEKMCSWSGVINGWILEGAQRHARLDICCCACLKMH